MRHPMLYFAYGSNMLAARLIERTPSATPHKRGRIRDRVLRFHKRGRDGSGKCDIPCIDQHDAAALNPDAADAVVHGVIFSVPKDEKPALDAAEDLGWGYDEKFISVETDEGQVEAFTYIARPEMIAPALQPFEWYRDLVIAGALEHALPPAYIANLQATATIADPDRDRAARWTAFARQAIARAGESRDTALGDSVD